MVTQVCLGIKLMSTSKACRYLDKIISWPWHITPFQRVKGGVRDFCKPMLTCEITKTNTPLLRKSLAIAPPHTYVRQRFVLWNKAKPMLLTDREETKQPRRPIASLPAPWVLSGARNLIRYLHGSYFMPYPNTVSTDASGAAIELIIISDAVYTGCCATENSCRVQLMTYWHKFKMIFNGHFVVSSVDRPREDNVWCVSLLLFHRRFCFYPPSLSFCRHSTCALMSALSSASWVDTPLTADWLQVCFGTSPDSMTERLMALFHCMVRHGTVRYGSLWGGFPLGTVPGTWYFFSTTSVEVPCKPYRYQNVTCKLCWSLIGLRKSSLLHHWTCDTRPSSTVIPARFKSAQPAKDRTQLLFKQTHIFASTTK